jgi:hypothetical protein
MEDDLTISSRWAGRGERAGRAANAVLAIAPPARLNVRDVRDVRVARDMRAAHVADAGSHDRTRSGQGRVESP